MDEARSAGGDAIVEQECGVCRQLRLDGPSPAAYELTPADGGGWQPWAAALFRLVVRVGEHPTQALIVTQDGVTGRYVQALIGHGVAAVQASSNVYLEGPSVLSVGEMELLTAVGWLPPLSDHDDPDEMPANWSLPYIRSDWPFLVEMMLATIVGIFGFDERSAVQVRTFGCDRPCRQCSWPELEPADARRVRSRPVQATRGTQSRRRTRSRE